MPSTLTTYTVVMPTMDSDGNPLTDGIGCGVAFDCNVTTITWTGTFAHSPPTSVSAGQVFNFTWSATSSSWWNA